MSGLNSSRRGGITTAFQLSFIFVHRIRTFGTEELQGVIRQHIGIRKDLVVCQVLTMLLDGELGVTFDQVRGGLTPIKCLIKKTFQVYGVLV